MLQLKAFYDEILRPELADKEHPPPSADSGHTPTPSKKDKGKQSAAAGGGRKEKEKGGGGGQEKKAKAVKEEAPETVEGVKCPKIQYIS